MIETCVDESSCSAREKIRTNEEGKERNKKKTRENKKDSFYHLEEEEG